MSDDEKKVSRRAALKVLTIAPLGAVALTQQSTPQQQPREGHQQPNQPARDTRQPAPAPPKRRFFTAKEMRTVRVLADDIIPRDARSGSATDAGVPEFMDFNLSVEETAQGDRIAMRGGLRWLDKESRRRFGKDYASAAAAQRHQILDDISWPATARPEFSHGVSFYTRFRDMVASGFFSSPQGYKDLRYMGHVFVPEWPGCPPEALRKLGVTYE